MSLRPSLPTSSTDFALPPSSTSSTGPSGTSTSGEDSSSHTLMHRFRRPSLLAPKASYLSDSRHQSPLSAAFTLPSRRRRPRHGKWDESSESDKDRMWTDSSPSSSSENPTPPLRGPSEGDDVENGRKDVVERPTTPPRNSSTANMDSEEGPSRLQSNRISVPLKPPRILNLLAESRPEEIEVKSEAAFQRLMSSRSELPMQPRTPRSISDRGRYPEEAVNEELQREETPSDDGYDEDSFTCLPSSSEPINIPKPVTPAHSVNGDDMSVSESPGITSMDVDMIFGSPSSVGQWRYTPPPTSASAVRSNKRKYDDRFDPYPTASKRRAVSPSFSFLRESHSALISPMVSSRTTVSNSRIPIPIPISIPSSATSSAASSPTISSSYPGSTSHARSMSICSSPILRPAIGLASPILRPLPRSNGMRRGDGEEREVEGAGEAVGGLNLGV